MNTKLVDSIIQLIMTLPEKEQELLKEKLLIETSVPSTTELMQLAQKSASLDFLYEEPDLYTLEDGEPI
ncbi:hypothetical protein Cri9333_0223 [Crinalium epipsammum PCC 9333]|uniref:Uncharacterized protein n=1 Tax=Crinalium epipsammum PCC 9333 TaxID=1173022 RepID=K9VUH6_9CYAN|nr:hypothetical protein [Crinalium epipsammum]AFZ11219.1 hypothetical protein Cri9333_0223 [Crinalium epipsammum PCC 9333]